MRKYKQAIIWFKKQLELAWFEKNRNVETSAYGNIGREHFYLGDLDRALYYNDRMVRGKVENEKSSLKTMSHHVVKNRRDAKLEKGFVAKPLVQRPDEQTLPSPREQNKSNNLVVPTVNLLPFYFVGENIVYQEALKEFNMMMKYNAFPRSKGKVLNVIDTRDFLDRQSVKFLNNNKNKTPLAMMNKMGQFTRQELLYMNKRPKIRGREPKGSLNNESTKPFRRNFFQKRDTEPMHTRHNSKSIPKKYDNEFFKNIVQAAKTKIGSSSSKRVYTLQSHMSELRTDPISHYKAEDIIETVKRGVVVLQFKFNESNNRC